MNVLDEIDAIDDNGNEYTILLIQEMVDTPSHADQHSKTPGLMSLELDDGSPVLEIDKDTFKIIATGRVIRRIK